MRATKPFFIKYFICFTSIVLIIFSTNINARNRFLSQRKTETSNSKKEIPENLSNYDTKDMHKKRMIKYWGIRKMGFCLKYRKTSFVLLSVCFLYLWESIFNNEGSIRILGVYEGELPWDREDASFRKKIGLVSTCTRGYDHFNDDGERSWEEVEAASYQNKMDYCKKREKEVDCLLMILDPRDIDLVYSYKAKLMLRLINYYEYLVWVGCNDILKRYTSSFRSVIGDNHNFWLGGLPYNISLEVYAVGHNAKMKIFLKRLLRVQRYLYYPAKLFLKHGVRGFKEEFSMFLTLWLSPSLDVSYVYSRQFLYHYPVYVGSSKKYFVGGDRGNFIEEAYCSTTEHYYLEGKARKGKLVKLCTALYENPDDKKVVNSSEWSYLLKNIKKMNETKNAYYLDLSMKLNPISIWGLTQGNQVYIPSAQRSHYELVRRSAIINQKKDFLHIEFMDLWDSYLLKKHVHSIPIDKKWFVLFKRSQMSKHIIEALYQEESEKNKGIMEYLYESSASKQQRKKRFWDKKKNLVCVERYCVLKSSYALSDRVLFEGKLAQYS